jgi:ABC-type Fe3+ transport system substrate-binding protein
VFGTIAAAIDLRLRPRKSREIEVSLRLVSTLISIVFSSWLTNCFAADRLVLMSPHPDEIQNEFENGFRKYYFNTTGEEVNLEWLDVGGGTGTIMRYIGSEFRRTPDGIGIDVFFGGGLDPYTELAEQGLTLPHRLPEELLERLPAKIGGVPLYDPQFRWYGATLAGFGIVYNKRVLELLGLPVPENWADLGNPDLFSWVGSGDPRSSGSVHMAYELILQAYGWDKGWEVITTIGANVRNFASGGAQAPKDVAVGEVAYGLSIDFYAWAQIERVGKEYVGFSMPDNLTIVNPDGMAILKGAPNLKVAQHFVEFVMSDAGQKLWFLKKGALGGPTVDQLNRFTVLPDLYDLHSHEAAVTLNPFLWTSDLVYDAQKGSARWSVLNDLIGVLVIDSHSQLQSAWKRSFEDGTSETEIARLSAMPVSEKECLQLAARWRDAELRSRTLAAWTDFARRKYGERNRSGFSQFVDWVTVCFPMALGCVMVLYLWRVRGR